MGKLLALVLAALSLSAATLIEDVTLISPERSASRPHTDVLIRDGKIAQIGTHLRVPAGTARIDGRGRYLVPGLIDSHVHLGNGNAGPLDDDAVNRHPELLADYHAQLPRSFLAFGFTTIIDLDMRRDAQPWFNAAPLHPSLFHCGSAVRIAGGYTAQRAPKDSAAANAANLVYGPASAKSWPAGLDPRDYTPQRAVERVVAAGGICVKTFIEDGFGGAAHWPVPSAETLAALRKETRRRGLPLLIHANAVSAWRAATAAQADVIAHGLWHWSGAWRNTTPPAEARAAIRGAAREHVAVQPTLQAVYGDLSIFDPKILSDSRFAEALPRSIVAYLKGDEGTAAQRAMADEFRQKIGQLYPDMQPLAVMETAPKRAAETLRIMLADDVKLLFGSDTPSNEGIGNPPGLNGRLEMTCWAEAGVPPARILRAATLDNAKMFHLDDRGTIEPGKRADLLLLGADPLKSVDAYDTIETVFVNGEAIPRASLLPEK